MKIFSILFLCIFSFILVAAPPVQKKAAASLSPEQKEANAKKAETAFRKFLESMKKDPGFVNRAAAPAVVYSTHRKRMKEKMELAKTGKEKVKILFLGDSITHGWERAGKALFKKNFAPYNTLNLGCNGNRTEHVVWTVEKSGILDHIRPELVVIMIGTNNLSRSYSPEAVGNAVKRIRDHLRKRYPEAKILLYGIFPREGSVAHPLRLLIAETNRLIAAFADGKNVFYEDIGNYMLTPGGVLPRSMMRDLLHPGEAGYRIWTDSIMEYVKKYVKIP